VKGDKLVDTGALERVRSQLEAAKVFEDENATVYDRELLERSRVSPFPTRRPSGTSLTTE
jgi:hypothetical protein